MGGSSSLRSVQSAGTAFEEEEDATSDVEMAGSLEEKQLVRHVYAALQAASCPLVEGLNLQEADSMLQLLCVPSQHRTDILAWICSSINPNVGNPKAMSVRSKDPDVLAKEMAVLWQELMLCKADELDLIRQGEASVYRQLQFLEQLLILVPGCKKSAGPCTDTEMLLNELYAAENLPHLSQMLKPTLDPWPAHIKSLQKGTKLSSTSCKPRREEAVDVATLLQRTQSALEQLQSECDFLNNEAQSPGVFSPSSLRVAACDLQRLIATFSHVFETDMRDYCSREPPSFSTDTDIFQRVHHLLLAFITELDLLKEVSEASVSMNEGVTQLQTQPCFQSQREKHTLYNETEYRHMILYGKGSVNGAYNSDQKGGVGTPLELDEMYACRPCLPSQPAWSEDQLVDLTRRISLLYS